MFLREQFRTRVEVYRLRLITQEQFLATYKHLPYYLVLVFLEMKIRGSEITKKVDLALLAPPNTGVKLLDDVAGKRHAYTRRQSEDFFTKVVKRGSKNE